MGATRSTTIIATLVVAAALALTGCTGEAAPDETGRPTATDGAAAPTPSGSVSPSRSETPPATSTAEPAVASIPTDCTDIVDQATYASTMGDVPLNDPQFFVDEPMGSVQPSAPPADADLGAVVDSAARLRCGWRDVRADITGLFVDVAAVDASTAAAYPTWLADPAHPQIAWRSGQAFDCSERSGGTMCQWVGPDPQYGTEFADTVFVRDGVVVSITQVNHPTNDLLGAVVTRIWG